MAAAQAEAGVRLWHPGACGTAGDRQRFAYRLTEQGLDLRPTLVALLEWGDKYFADPQGPSVIVRHRVVSHDVV